MDAIARDGARWPAAVGASARAPALGLVGALLCLCAGASSDALAPLEALLLAAIAGYELLPAAEAAAALAEAPGRAHRAEVLRALPRLRCLPFEGDEEEYAHAVRLLDAAASEMARGGSDAA